MITRPARLGNKTFFLGTGSFPQEGGCRAHVGEYIRTEYRAGDVAPDLKSPSFCQTGVKTDDFLSSRTFRVPEKLRNSPKNLRKSF